jgi:hypothetical protein
MFIIINSVSERSKEGRKEGKRVGWEPMMIFNKKIL